MITAYTYFTIRMRVYGNCSDLIVGFMSRFKRDQPEIYGGPFRSSMGVVSSAYPRLRTQDSNPGPSVRHTTLSL